MLVPECAVNQGLVTVNITGPGRRAGALHLIKWSLPTVAPASCSPKKHRMREGNKGRLAFNETNTSMPPEVGPDTGENFSISTAAT